MNRMFMLLCFAMLSTLPPHSVRAGSGENSAAPQKELHELSLEELMQVEVATVYSASKFEQKVTLGASMGQEIGSEMNRP